MRQNFVLIHRYVGLVMTLFLVVAGFTGMFLAFYNELDDYINRDIVYVQAPYTNAQRLDPFTLRDKVAAEYPQAQFDWVELNQEAGQSVMFNPEPKTNPATNKPYVFDYDEIYVNPYTAETIAKRKWGEISKGWINLMPFIYQLHYSLALDTIGSYAFGIIALLWTLDCFVGAYLTFPARQKQSFHRQPLSANKSLSIGMKVAEGKVWQPSKSWSKRWWKSWKIRWSGGAYKVNFDLHRAGGLWVWAMLFVLAWSSVGLNLQEIYSPVTKALFQVQKTDEDLPKLSKPLEQPALDFRKAYAVAQVLILQEAQAKNFSVLEPVSMSYNPEKGYYRYRVKSSLDVSEKYGSTAIYIDANTGKKLFSYLPSGEASGDTVTQWLFALHMAQLWGLPMQVFISFMGFVVTLLSITGLYIWLKKRAAKQDAKHIVTKYTNAPIL